MVICLERGADLYMTQLMPLPLTVSCFSKIQIGFTLLALAHPGSPGQRAICNTSFLELLLITLGVSKLNLWDLWITRNKFMLQSRCPFCLPTNSVKTM